MDQRWVELARTLRDLGMWRDFSEEEAAAAERAVAEGAYPFGGTVTPDEEAGLRYFFVDGEAMAEDGVTRLLADFEPVLRAHGVELQVENVNRPRRIEVGDDYVVAINGRRCVVWTSADWDARRAWETATVRPFAVINDLLAEAGAVPRFFTLYAGSNGSVVWLLNPRIVAAVAESGLVERVEVPALATHD
jgi:hypothetical protein